MAAKILPAGNLQSWIDKLVARYEVFAPVEGSGSSSFKPVKTGQSPALDVRTDVPPKGIIFKQVEKLLTYSTGESGVEVTETPVKETAKVIFGIRPCDARAFALTDKVFVESEMPEAKYTERRKQTAVITVGCTEACKTCFCTSVGGSPAERAGDVYMIDLGDKYLVEALTSTGEKMLEAGKGLLSDAKADDEAAARKTSDEVAESIKKMRVPDAKALDGLFTDEAFWNSLSEKCLSCGACTFLCPTCYCFDVRDEGSVQQGERYRRWDSCMFFQYNRAAGGHNPRDQHWKRMRQRMLHKFSYFVANTGEYSCVGCGRCIRSCPVSYDLREFLEKSFHATSSEHLDFKAELPSESEELEACDVPVGGKSSKTGVGSDV
ncbi:MAG TPA: 4Fe-4S dicluster domain-containing protein [Candidatus Aquicultor sp.]|jgi:ferredoxin